MISKPHFSGTRILQIASILWTLCATGFRLSTKHFSFCFSSKLSPWSSNEPPSWFCWLCLSDPQRGSQPPSFSGFIPLAFPLHLPMSRSKVHIYIGSVSPCSTSPKYLIVDLLQCSSKLCTRQESLIIWIDVVSLTGQNYFICSLGEISLITISVVAVKSDYILSYGKGQWKKVDGLTALMGASGNTVSFMLYNGIS